MDYQNDKLEKKKPNRRSIILGLLIGLIAGIGFGFALDSLPIGIALGLSIGAALSTNKLRQKPPMKIARNDMIRILIGLALYMIGILGGITWSDAVSDRSMQIIAASLPILPGIFFVYAVGKAISNLDEMQRRIQTEALAIAFAGTFLVTQSYGLLGEVGIPQVSWVFVPLVMVFFWMVGKLWLMRKYQ
ncbi:MAG: hypothetical protein JEZ06_03840 [Anaerolineaceae bacterium]|nr:hypothetical protein [Anaerolineaceae bacterium]